MKLLLLIVCAVAAFPQTIAAVNAGGPAVTDAGTSFLADAYFSSGTAFAATGSTATTFPSTLPAQYRTQRYGNFSYTFAVAPGNYDLALHFYELASTVTGPGQRRFKISINGVDTFPDFDIWDTASPTPRGPRVQTVRIASTGEVRIQFATITRNAVLNAVTLARVPDATIITERVETYRITSPSRMSFEPQLPIAPNAYLHVYRNGLLQTLDSDYSIVGHTVTFRPRLNPDTQAEEPIPIPGDTVTLIYHASLYQRGVILQASPQWSIL